MRKILNGFCYHFVGVCLSLGMALSIVFVFMLFVTWTIGCSPVKEVAPSVEQREEAGHRLDLSCVYQTCDAIPGGKCECVTEFDALNLKNGDTLRIGFDYLALLHPRADGPGFARTIRPRSQIGILDHTFGVNPGNLELALATRKVALVRVQMINAVCARNRRCKPEDGIARGLDSKGLDKAIREGRADKQLRSRTAVFRGLSERYGVPFAISPLLEHDQSKEAWMHAATVIREVWPGVRLVNNPHSGFEGRPLGAWLERHGNNPRGNDVSSLDGKDLYDLGSSSRQAWRARTKPEKYTFSWIKGSNCLGSGAWVAPSKRKDCVRGDGLKKWAERTYN